MTALKEYDRLEATGLWRETPDAQRRDVMVSFGKATLIIRDKSDAALAHWSLPAIERLNPGVMPALFRPGSDAMEELELSEPSLVEAIEKVRKSVARARPRSGRLRGLIFVGILASILGLCYFWLPDALVRHTVSVVPESKRLAIGQSLVGHIGRLTGGMCRSRDGTAALNRLKTRVFDEGAKQAAIMRAGPDRAILLPGGIILLGRGLVEDHETPDVLAGYMLVASTQAQMSDPLEQLLDHIGARETLHLLTTGQLKEEVLRSYAETLIGLELTDPPTEQLLRNFKLAEVASTPYGYARDLTGEATLELIEADPYLNAKTPPILSDGDWVTLQEICSAT